jgi:penicillin-binding protein 1A
MAEALAKSINTVAVKISEKVGYKTVVNTARRLGITSDLLATPSLALGASSVSLIEMTAIYGVFANGGFGLWPYGIEEIIDGEGRVLYRRQGSGPGRVIDTEYAGAMNAMLAGVMKSGTGKAANFKRPLGGKTGTSQNFRDAWFIGYSADLVAGVWMGNDNHSAMKNISGSGIPAQIWRQFMIDSHVSTPIRSLLGVGKQLPKKARLQGPPTKDKEEGFWDKLIGVIIGTKN